MSEHPELDKMLSASDEAATLSSFLDWLGPNGLFIGT